VPPPRQIPGYTYGFAGPAEYTDWSILREKVYSSKIADVDELKTRLIDE